MPPTDAPAPAPAPEESLLCPACGFDLRATEGDRCGECGLDFDRDALRVTAIPWAHRRRIGRARAYLKTMWQILLDRPALRHEASKPQDPADARAFRRVTAAVLATTFVGAFFVLAYSDGTQTALRAIRPGYPGNVPDSPWLDLAIPWLAGATLLPVLPVALAALAFYLTGTQRFVFRAGAPGSEHRRRAVALAHYTTAPLVLLLPAALFALAARWIAIGWHENGPLPAAVLALIVAATTLFLVSILATVARTAQWIARTRHCGFAGVLLPVAEALGLGLLGAAVLLVLLPWCAGLLWIAVDSLR